MITKFLARLEQHSPVFGIVIGFTIIAGLGVLDYLTGYELSLTLFYLFPIALITWLAGWQPGIAASLFSTLIWLGTNIINGRLYSHVSYSIWNTLIVFSFFVIITILLAALKRTLNHERALAHTDYLTGAVNSRFFSELLQMEIDRSKRYSRPFTIAYIDLDNFKTVNDQFGHSAGDLVLQVVVQQIKTQLRKTDIVARLGGDEFALLLPETGPEAARVVLSKTQNSLQASMQKNYWPVTFSTGVLTVTASPPAPDELIQLVDELMYSVKRNGKNAVKFVVYTD